MEDKKDSCWCHGKRKWIKIAIFVSLSIISGVVSALMTNFLILYAIAYT